jgi:hypothetical protein
VEQRDQLQASLSISTTVNLRYVVRLAATAALGGLLFGFDIAIITGAGPFLIQHFGLSDLSLDARPLLLLLSHRRADN